LDKNTENNLTNQELTNYDVCELYIRCIATFVDKCSKYELSNAVPFTLGRQLWEETMETLGKYREGTPIRPQTEQPAPPKSFKR